MASRYGAIPDANTKTAVVRDPSWSNEVGGSQTQTSGQFSGIDNPEALDILMKTLNEMKSGGSEDVKAMRGERMGVIRSAKGTLGDYTKGAAFTDAGNVMAGLLRQSMEKNMPAINKSIQGAGTSSSSMAGLLSQKLATEASQATSAVQLDAAKAYGGITGDILRTLEGLTRADYGNQDSILKALELFKNSRQYSFGQTTPSMRQSGGGGERVVGAAGGVVASGNSSPYQDGVWYGPPTSGDSSYVPVGTSRSYYPDGKMPYAAPYGGYDSGGGGSNIQQGMSSQDLANQANQSNSWATSTDWGYGD